MFILRTFCNRATFCKLLTKEDHASGASSRGSGCGQGPGVWEPAGPGSLGCWWSGPSAPAWLSPPGAGFIYLFLSSADGAAPRRSRRLLPSP